MKLLFPVFEKPKASSVISKKCRTLWKKYFDLRWLDYLPPMHGYKSSCNEFVILRLGAKHRRNGISLAGSAVCLIIGGYMKIDTRKNRELLAVSCHNYGDLLYVP